MLTMINRALPTNIQEDPHDWLIRWKAETSFAGPVELVLRAFNLRTILSANWQAFSCDLPETSCTWQTPETTNLNRINTDNPKRLLATFKSQSAVQAGTEITFAITAIPPFVAWADLPVYLDVVDSEGNVCHTEGPVSMQTRSGAASDLHFVCRPAPEADGTIRAVIQPVGDMDYPAALSQPVDSEIRGDDGTLMWQGSIKEALVVLLEGNKVSAGKNVTRFCLLLSDELLKQQPNWRNPVRRNDKIVFESNPVVLHRVSDCTPAFGALHWHTQLSGDGMRTIEQGLTYARDSVNLDFIAPGDHTPCDAKWQHTVKALNDFNQDGQFATLFGWELSCNEGHVNFYFTDPDHPMNPDRFREQTHGSSKPAEYLSLLAGNDFLAIPHHSNATSWATRDDGSHYWQQFPWGEPRDEFLRQVEIFQVRGNFEREDPPDGWRTVFRNNGSSAYSALKKGHKIGFVGGTDNHLAWPTRLNDKVTKRSYDEKRSNLTGFIYTGAWLPRRDRAGVFSALYQRHTWACWDTRAIVCFSLNKVLQGGEIAINTDTAVSATILLVAEAPLDTLELVSAKQCWQVPRDENQRDIQADMSLQLTADDQFVYLRARQTNGALIYASPIFINP